jgi:hypothetical protein
MTALRDEPRNNFHLIKSRDGRCCKRSKRRFLSFEIFGIYHPFYSKQIPAHSRLRVAFSTLNDRQSNSSIRQTK